MMANNPSRRKKLGQISKSKQLLQKTKSRNNLNQNNTTKQCKKREQKEPKLCDNKIRMPSLADLEEMFQSDDLEILPSTSGSNSTQVKNDQTATRIVSDEPKLSILVPRIILNDIEHRSTAQRRKNPCATDKDFDGLTSNKRLKIHHNSDTSELGLCNSPESTSSSKSTGLAPTEEYDSDATIIYEDTSGRFSPLPSTSNNNEIILKNDEMFNASLTKVSALQNDVDLHIFNETPETHVDVDLTTINEISPNNVIENDPPVEIIESPIEIITINDDTRPLRRQETNNSQISIIIDDDDTTNENEVINITENTGNSLESIRSQENTVSVVETPPILVEVSSQTDINEVVDVENYVSSRSNLSTNAANNQNSTEAIPDNSRSSILGFRIPNSVSKLLRKMEKILTDYSKESQGNNRNLNQINNSNQMNQQTPTNSQINNKKPSHKTGKNSFHIHIDEEVLSGNSSRPLGLFKSCPICYDNLTNKTIASTICGHVFCMVCIQESTKVVKRCPTCRKKLRSNGYHQLFW